MLRRPRMIAGPMGSPGQTEPWHDRCEDFLLWAKLKRAWQRRLTSTEYPNCQTTVRRCCWIVSVTDGNLNEKEVSHGPLFVQGHQVYYDRRLYLARAMGTHCLLCSLKWSWRLHIVLLYCISLLVLIRLGQFWIWQSSLPRMPGNHVPGNGFPATFVPGRRNVFEGYWVANESWKKIIRFSFQLLLKRIKYFTNSPWFTSLGKENQSENSHHQEIELVCSHSSARAGILHSQWLVPYSATTVEADFALFDRRLDNTRHRFLNKQNHLPYQKLHLRNRFVVPGLLKTRKLLSKFENPTPGAKSPSFFATRKIPWQSRKELHLQLGASCGVYHHGFQSTSNQ